MWFVYTNIPKRKANWKPFIQHDFIKAREMTVDNRWWCVVPTYAQALQLKKEMHNINPNPKPSMRVYISKHPKVKYVYENAQSSTKIGMAKRKNN